MYSLLLLTKCHHSVGSGEQVFPGPLKHKTLTSTTMPAQPNLPMVGWQVGDQLDVVGFNHYMMLIGMGMEDVLVQEGDTLRVGEEIHTNLPVGQYGQGPHLCLPVYKRIHEQYHKIGYLSHDECTTNPDLYYGKRLSVIIKHSKQLDHRSGSQPATDDFHLPSTVLQ